MKIVAVALLVCTGIIVGTIITKHVSTDCTPWLASIKLCATTITK